MYFMPVIMGRDRFLDFLERADENKDGRISRDELRNALKAAGLRFTTVKAWLAMRKCDHNRNGVIEGDKEMASLLSYANQKWNVLVM